MSKKESSIEELIKFISSSINDHGWDLQDALDFIEMEISKLEDYKSDFFRQLERANRLISKVNTSEGTNELQTVIKSSREKIKFLREEVREYKLLKISLRNSFDRLNDQEEPQLNSIKSKIDGKTQINSIQHIHWLKSDNNSLEQFIEALKEYNLIETRDTEAIIKDHFKTVKEQNREPEPIEWLNTQTLLAYMIEQLDETYIQTNNIWIETAPHFSINGKKLDNRILNSSANNYKDNQTGRNGGWSGKPKNYQLIDNILQSLPE